MSRAFEYSADVVRVDISLWRFYTNAMILDRWVVFFAYYNIYMPMAMQFPPLMSSDSRRMRFHSGQRMGDLLVRHIPSYSRICAKPCRVADVVNGL